MGVALEMTDQLEMELIGPGIPVGGQLRHGSATWRITAPLLILDVFSMGVATIEELHPHSYHRYEEFDLEPVAQRAYQVYQEIQKVDEHIAQASLPRFVRATMMITMPLSEIITHLLEWDRHPEVVRTLNTGILRTLEESDPELGNWIARQLTAKGVLEPSSDQEKIANQQEVQHV